jgi:uncharacterized protein (TIGR03118 family)
MIRRPLRIGIVLAIAAALAGGLVLLPPHEQDAYAVTRLVSDNKAATTRDAQLVNGFGLAASATGPWWLTSEARGTSPLYAANGRKQALTVKVEGGPTGIVYNAGSGFLVHGGGRSGSARFIYACEDGNIRAWAPNVPTGWSDVAEVAVSSAGTGAIFGGLALARLPDGSRRLYAANFHNDRVDVYDEHWRHLVDPKAFVDLQKPAWFAPFGIQAIGDRIFITYTGRAPVDGNNSPAGGYVDEFDLHGKLIAHVGESKHLDAPWGMAVAPRSFGHFGGDLLVANFGSGHVTAYRRAGGGWRYHGQLGTANGKPLVLQGVWGIAFGRGGMSGPKDTLFFAAGPHTWRGETEQAVHGLFGSVSRVR